MDRTPDIIERAYQVAKSGQCIGLRDIRRQLTREGYESVGPHLSGSSIKRQLRALIKAARESGEPRS